MRSPDRDRPTRGMLAALAVTLGLGSAVLAACGSSDASSPTTPSSAPVPTTQPAATTPPATTPQTTAAPATSVAVATTTASTDAPAPAATEPPAEGISVTDVDVADLEKQLDDIDQLLAGVDADLKQD